MSQDMSAVAEITRRLQARVPVIVGESPYEIHSVRPIPKIECADGFSVSVQAWQWAYCAPRDSFGPWTAFELGFPSAPDDLIEEYAECPHDPTQTVYGYVPDHVVEALIQKHGGIALRSTHTQGETT